MARTDWKIGGWVAKGDGVQQVDGQKDVRKLFDDAVQLAEALKRVLGTLGDNEFMGTQAFLDGLRRKPLPEARITSLGADEPYCTMADAINQLLRDVAELRDAVRERLPRPVA